MKQIRRMRRLELSLILGFLLTLCISPVIAFAQQCEEVRSEAIRLHIIANSDSGADQALKLQVRDVLLSTYGESLLGFADTQQAQAYLEEHMDEIVATAQQEVTSQGYEYPVTAQMVEMYFATTAYEQFTMPAGDYRTLRIEIGEARGKNWWCVMFPPMCIPAAQEYTEKSDLQQEIEHLGDAPSFKPAFAVVEWVEDILHEK